MSIETSDYEKSIWGRPGTIRTYSNLFKNHIAENITRDELLQLDENKLLALIQLWLNDGLGDRTIKQLVRMVTRYSRHLGGSPPETAPLLRKLSRQKQENSIKSLTAKESKILLDYLSDKHLSLYLICLFGIHAGLRRGEIFGLQYGDIDALKNRITVQRSYAGPTKNGKTRVVPLSERLAKALESKDYLTNSPTEAIFQIFDPNADLRKICKHLKIREITIHDLRHTFATLALESGVSPRTVQSWLGHSSLTTTLNIYWSALPTEQSMDFAP
jgi:integrase